MEHAVIDRLSLESAKVDLRQAAEVRGHVASLMAQTPQYREYPMACLTAWIETPIELDQIKVFFAPGTGFPVGYVTWAFLAPDVEHRWLTDPAVTLHFSEWNEGDRLWIMDFVAPFGYAYDIARYMQRYMFPAHAQAQWLRRSPDGTVRHHRLWNRTR